MNPESWTKILSGFYYVTKEEQTHMQRSSEVVVFQPVCLKSVDFSV